MMSFLIRSKESHANHQVASGNVGMQWRQVLLACIASQGEQIIRCNHIHEKRFDPEYQYKGT